MTPAEADREWYRSRGCDHAHCPTGHDKPQPSLSGGRMLCMRCLVVDGVETEVVPCTPENCGDESQPVGAKP